MKKNFNDYLAEYKTYRKVSDTKQLRYLFDNIINSDENIIKMYNQIIIGKPAIAAIADDIENYYDSLAKKDFIIDANSDDDEIVKQAKLTKRAIGAMIGTVMRSLGYTSKSQKDLSVSCNRKYFVSGSTYEYVGGETMKVVQQIVHLED